MPDFEAHQAKNARLGAEIRPRLAGHLDLAYGETPLQKLDLFPTQPRDKGPAQIFRDFILRARATSPSARPAQAAPGAPGRRPDDLVDSIRGWFGNSPPPIIASAADAH